MLKRLFPFLLVIIIVQVQAQQVEKGVSYQLATARHAAISRVSYQLFFDIPADKSVNIAASAVMSFNLTTIPELLQLDFRQDSSHVKAVKINGISIPVKMLKEHLLVDKKFLVRDSNSISIDFIAGNESLNRNNDYLYALFVPDRARTVFPCFDQPDLKANYDLTLSVPRDWSVLANAAVEDSSTNETKTVYRFKQSDKLPTYLFSFTAGRYTVLEKAGMRFLYRETDTAKIRLSVDSVFREHQQAIHFLETWTGIPFPFQKIGFAAIPSFQFGGMEHPGEVQYNSAALFLDEGATKDQLIGRAALISHETAHMWFGDLVTMKWFNDVWMKEVFANFMADKVTENLMGSETFHLKFLLDHTPAAYGVDRTAGANAIRQQLDNLQEAGSMYGNIIYHKAPIMMRQLELLMGKENFRQGVQEYLHKYQYSNARWDDLIAILGKHTSANLVSWNKVWVNRPGRPVFNYQYANGKLIITQKAERGSAAIWPERFDVVLFYGSKQETVAINMQNVSATIPVTSKPDHILFNADGMGYGLFPAFVNDQVYQLKSPLQRAAAYINNYENMLAGKSIPASKLLDLLLQGVSVETNELNLRLLCGYAGNIYWNFLSPAERLAKVSSIETLLWKAMSQQAATNNKKIIFRTYQDVYSSAEAGQRMYQVWQSQKAPDSIKLTEDDYTSIATTIALKTDSGKAILQEQLLRISNPDRKARLEFLMPALSADSHERDVFFAGLKDINNRRKEAWVSTALSYMNHPLRQSSFMKWLPTSLEMLEDIQRTGDIFFPQNWLGAVFGSHQSKQAWQTVAKFLASHPNYNPRLKNKILQATDNLHRAAIR